jgi:hypothetical protein
MGPPIPHDTNKPPERDPRVLESIENRWGRAAVEQLYAQHLPNGTRWVRFASRGRLAWVVADTPRSGSTLFARTGDAFTSFSVPRFSGAEPTAFAAILEDAQVDVVGAKEDVLTAFGEITGAEIVRTQEEAESLLKPTWGPGSGADPAAVASFEPPHFEGRALAFVATYAYAAKLIRVVIDADTLAVRTHDLGRSQQQLMPVG